MCLSLLPKQSNLRASLCRKTSEQSSSSPLDTSRNKTPKCYWFVTFTLSSQISASNIISLYLPISAAALTGTRHEISKHFGTCRDLWGGRNCPPWERTKGNLINIHVCREAEGSVSLGLVINLFLLLSLVLSSMLLLLCTLPS